MKCTKCNTKIVDMGGLYHETGQNVISVKTQTCSKACPPWTYYIPNVIISILFAVLVLTPIIASLIFLFWDLISVKIVHYSSTSTSGLSKNFLKYSLSLMVAQF